MDLKYAGDLAQIEDCPVNGSAPIAIVAYRFVFGEGSREKNFTCPSKLNPKRSFGRDLACVSLALSFYTTKECAGLAYASLLKTHKNIRKSIGDSIAELQILEDDGLASAVDGAGHFDLWESASADFSGRVISVGAITS